MVTSQPGLPEQASRGGVERCSACLERVAAHLDTCPECGESLGAQSPRISRVDLRMRGWFGTHWRPVVTLSVIGALLGSGVALRTLAPEAFTTARAAATPSVAVVEPACDIPCWNGEACEAGACVFHAGNDVGRLPAGASVAGPFRLPEDFVDVLPIDPERYLTSSMAGVQVSSARSGEPLTLISDAPLARGLYRVGDFVYATSLQSIYVIEPRLMTVQKAIEVGWPVADLAEGATGARVVVSLPAARAVAVIATDYHAEVSRFTFGEDQVGPVALDDAGKRAMATNGQLPLPGFKASTHSTSFGASYAFDPSRLPSQQDRVRTGMVGNPIDVMIAPNASTSFVVIRERDAVVPLEHPPNESIRQLPPISVCSQPEQIALVRDGRRALVRCNVGHAVEVIDLARRQPVRRIELNARVSDLVVTPDGKQAVLALPRDGAGAVGLLDLATYQVQLVPLSGEAHRVRLTPDGKVAVAISDTTKAAWVLR